MNCCSQWTIVYILKCLVWLLTRTSSPFFRSKGSCIALTNWLLANCFLGNPLCNPYMDIIASLHFQCNSIIFLQFTCCRIMMLTVTRSTKSPVKFWFLKNYLSPYFKEFIPFMAKRYGFEYELVQYQWPRWLNAQTEKQRIIWGYKILFLDVLFPLDVKKIIFVDADQVCLRAKLLRIYLHLIFIPL